MLWARSGVSQEEALQRLEVNLICCRASACRGDLPAWEQQLRSLVQAGIPMVCGWASCGCSFPSLAPADLCLVAAATRPPVEAAAAVRGKGHARRV